MALVKISKLGDSVVHDYEKTIYMLVGAVGLLLLIACANVSNLLLARATVREKELAIRISLRSGRVRIIRQLLIEGVLLANGGCRRRIYLMARTGLGTDDHRSHVDLSRRRL
jgi:hypothetical protein